MFSLKLKDSKFQLQLPPGVWSCGVYSGPLHIPLVPLSFLTNRKGSDQDVWHGDHSAKTRCVIGIESIDL